MPCTTDISCRRAGLLFLSIAVTACASGDGDSLDTVATMDSVSAHAAFFQEISGLCGQRFPGQTITTPTPTDPMAGAALEMEVAECSDGEIRIPFRVNDDSSRTWILTLADTGLLLKHDHRHSDGTPDSVTNYGGWSTDSGTATRQHFAADPFTAELIPAASTNVWTMELDRGANRFVYALMRSSGPRYRAEFDISASQ